ncbi:MAG: hypothetical protein ACFFA6_13965 [Promethearchaeota archaeon]
MDMPVTIEEFHALLTSSEKDDDPWWTAWRKLATIEEPEDVAALAEGEQDIWGGWGE